MARPWQRILVEEDPGVLEMYPDGRLMHGISVAMSAEDVETTRNGAKCINCFENFDSETPGGIWPEECFVCGFPVKEQQAEHFARVYAGYDSTLRTGANWEAEADRIADKQERRTALQRAKESGIWLGSKRVGDAIDRIKGKS